MQAIKKDRHSLYVIYNNGIYRPILTSNGDKLYGHIPQKITKFKANQRIKIIGISDTPLVNVRSVDGKSKEMWHYHGSLIEKNKSFHCWEPFNE